RRCARGDRDLDARRSRRGFGGAGMSGPVFENLSVGDVIVEHAFHLTRDSLVRYAGASGDFNPIHYRDDVARSVGLPGVLAHGMLTMGVAASPVAEWISGSGHVADYQV